MFISLLLPAVDCLWRHPHVLSVNLCALIAFIWGLVIARFNRLWGVLHWGFKCAGAILLVARLLRKMGPGGMTPTVWWLRKFMHWLKTVSFSAPQWPAGTTKDGMTHLWPQRRNTGEVDWLVKWDIHQHLWDRHAHPTIQTSWIFPYQESSCCCLPSTWSNNAIYQALIKRVHNYSQRHNEQNDTVESLWAVMITVQAYPALL